MKQIKKYLAHKVYEPISIKEIVTIHYQELSRNYASESEFHDFWEIIYSDTNRLDVVADERVFKLEQGEMIVVYPNSPHYVECNDGDANIFIISFVCKDKAMREFARTPVTVPNNYRYLLQNIMSEAADTFVIPDFNPNLQQLKLRSNPNFGGDHIIKNALETLLIYLLRDTVKPTEIFFTSARENSSDLLDEIIDFLSSKIYDKFVIAELCDKMHYGKTYLCEFFKKNTGASIYSAYLKMKITEAKKLIRHGAAFSEISELLYFDTLSHFTSAFKKQVGMTPREYKKSII